ncbi:hypothetical protein CRUP_038589 [Coryphaenoides rupestris]|nr:hypothetical protein CRUP_038589 [Coryphaenoides rupestris]
MELENIVANTVLLKAREGEFCCPGTGSPPLLLSSSSSCTSALHP